MITTANVEGVMALSAGTTHTTPGLWVEYRGSWKQIHLKQDLDIPTNRCYASENGQRPFEIPKLVNFVLAIGTLNELL